MSGAGCRDRGLRGEENGEKGMQKKQRKCLGTHGTLLLARAKSWRGWERGRHNGCGRGVCTQTPGITETAEEVFGGTNSRDCPTEQCRAQHKPSLLTEASKRCFSSSVLWSTDGFKVVMIVA